MPVLPFPFLPASALPQPQKVSFLFLDFLLGPHGRRPDVGMELTARPLGPLQRYSETNFPRMRASGGRWLGWEQCWSWDGLLQRNAWRLQGRSREESVMSKPAFIYFSLRSFLGASLTAEAKERL